MRRILLGLLLGLLLAAPTARSAAADMTPSLTCTIAGTGSATHCRALTSTTTDVAAGATIAVKAVTLEDLSAQDIWCELYFSLS